jgi:hypothetical protein
MLSDAQPDYVYIFVMPSKRNKDIKKKKKVYGFQTDCRHRARIIKIIPSANLCKTPIK